MLGPIQFWERCAAVLCMHSGRYMYIAIIKQEDESLVLLTGDVRLCAPLMQPSGQAAGSLAIGLWKTLCFLLQKQLHAPVCARALDGRIATCNAKSASSCEMGLSCCDAAMISTDWLVAELGTGSGSD